MSSSKDFVIENDVLKKYQGSDTDVIIPDGVTSIGAGAFKNCTALIVITIPNTVTSIGNSAFYGCSNLTTITIPDTVTSIGEDAFYDCNNLTTVTIPQQMKTIDLSAFAFSGIKRIPNLVDCLMEGRKIINVFPQLALSSNNLEHCAAIYLTQNSKKILFQFQSKLYADLNKTVAAMTKLLAKAKRKPTQYKKAAEFALKHKNKLTQETFDSLYEVLLQAKSSAAQLLAEYSQQESTANKLEKNNPSTVPVCNSPENQSLLIATDHPSEQFCKKHYNESSIKRILKRYGIDLCDIPLVRYRDCNGAASPFTIGCVLSNYLDKDDIEIELPEEYLSKDSEQIINTMNPSDFQQMLENLYTLIDEKKGITKSPIRYFLIPYCLYGSAAQIKKIIINLNAWNKWGDYGRAGRDTALLAGFCLCLSRHREALIWAEKNDYLYFTADIRGIDEDTLRDTIVMDFGLDTQGQKTYNLGSKSLKAAVTSDLTFILYDEEKGKELKSIPQKGSDPELYELAKNDFEDLKKNLKKSVKIRLHTLFTNFLDNKSWTADNWKYSYLSNPILHQIASLLVWKQGPHTFTITNNDVITSDQISYSLSNGPIFLAHPMEMNSQDIKNWQKHFASHNLKQPFLQIWEPVIPFDSIRQDRYQNCTILANLLRSQDKHGIYFAYNYTSSELDLDFKDISLEYHLTEYVHHTLSQDARVEFGRLEVKRPTRWANHILGLLDKWTVADRILKDDSSIVHCLDIFTLAQITELLSLSIEHNSSNCTAILLEYKNKHFSDFNPIDEFTLD